MARIGVTSRLWTLATAAGAGRPERSGKAAESDQKVAARVSHCPTAGTRQVPFCGRAMMLLTLVYRGYAREVADVTALPTDGDDLAGGGRHLLHSRLARGSAADVVFPSGTVHINRDLAEGVIAAHLHPFHGSIWKTHRASKGAVVPLTLARVPQRRACP
jgi:hypothetical protein